MSHAIGPGPTPNTITNPINENTIIRPVAMSRNIFGTRRGFERKSTTCIFTRP